MWERAYETVKHTVGVVLGRREMKLASGVKSTVWFALGTCYAVTQDGGPKFVTNAHVVQDSGSEPWTELAITLLISSKAILAGARVKVHEPSIDIAVLEASTEAKVAPVVRFVRGYARAGAPIASIGYPLPDPPEILATGKGKFSAYRRLSAGYISSDQRIMLIPGDSDPFEHVELNLLSYPGNSGAPCFNPDGEVVCTNRGTQMHGNTVAAFALAIPTQLVLGLLDREGIRYAEA